MRADRETRARMRGCHKARGECVGAYGSSVVISDEGKELAGAKSLYGGEGVYAELPTAR